MEDLKNIINQAGATLGRKISIFDNKGVVVYSTEKEQVNKFDDVASAFSRSTEKLLKTDTSQMLKIYISGEVKLIVSIQGLDDETNKYLQLVAGWLTSALMMRNQEAECESFLKNVLLENELPGDIPLKAREFQLTFSLPRQCFYVHPSVGNSNQVRELVESDRNYCQKWNYLPLDENNFVLIVDLDNLDEFEREELPNAILEFFEKNLGCRVNLGVGMPVDTLKDIPKSYREASLALTVGKIFTDDQRIMRYNKLGLGRLIYQLPPTLCQMFLSEVFDNNTYEELDEETLLTIQKFFENNLNGSETSRQLFVHRNTLVYRLDKVQKITGLDLRSFDDAVLFKLASMVRKYLETIFREAQSLSK